MRSVETQIVALGEFDPVIKQTISMLESHGNRSHVLWEKAYLYIRGFLCELLIMRVNLARADLSTDPTALAPC